MSEWDSLPWWRRFKEANATERAYVIVLVVFFALFVAGAFFFDHPVLGVLVPVLLVIAVVLEQRVRTRKD
jgi:TRAP-type C4-dicarboxylate transport system permease large subunit